MLYNFGKINVVLAFLALAASENKLYYYKFFDIQHCCLGTKINCRPTLLTAAANLFMAVTILLILVFCYIVPGLVFSLQNEDSTTVYN